MPVTHGHGNPDWTREETVLALDLLYRHGKPIDRRHKDVLELSELLRSARIYPVEKRNEKFRNPDGVALKLQNLFSAVEPGRGLTYSRTDLAVATDYPKTSARELAELADALRKSLTDDVTSGSDDGETFTEGAWLTARHRQRDARLRAKYLNRLKDTDLRCEICNFIPPSFDRKLQESLFETHHVIPLADAEGMRTTRVSDLSLLCACCHRLLHKLISSRKRWVGVAEARQLIVETQLQTSGNSRAFDSSDEVVRQIR